MKKTAVLAAASAIHLLDRMPPHVQCAPTANTVSVVGPAAHGSFGDEAMLIATTQASQARGATVQILAPGPPASVPGSPVIRTVAFGANRKAAGFLLNRPVTAVPGETLVIGADSFDTAYGVRGVSRKISALNNAVRAGGTAALVNFSLREHRGAAADRLLKHLDKRVSLWTRDLRSKQRAEELFGREAGCRPDIAAHMPPKFNDAETVRRADRATIGLVVNGHLAKMMLSGRAGVVDYFRRLGQELLTRTDELWVIAHDVRESPGDPSLAEAVVGALGPRASVRVPTDAAYAKGLISELDICVSSRMHAAVASLSQGVPTVGLDYVDKFHGQFAWYDEMESVVPIGTTHITDALARVDAIAADIAGHRSRITQKATEVLSMDIPWTNLKG